ncbi:MAG: Asp23/Gls24 family envelope stress response protein [Erysipelotrichaceae bacterium]|nr:Asp23/Gls24 family envelope stress response protein [Erysipelotrichaceae bacterium]
MEKYDTNVGTYQISDKAFEDIASIVCENTKNVYPVKRDKGFVEAKFNKENELTLTINIKVKQGVDIVKLCNKLQDEIAENILLMTGMETQSINVDIQGFEK